MKPTVWILASAVTLALAGTAFAQDAKWMRYPAIAPDGKTIAFSYRGDLWTVPATGGDARPITTHEGYERSAVWSPDGRWIAFASDRHGQFDVFVVADSGGRARRLTFHSAADVPSAFTPDGSRVLFSSRRLDAPGSSAPSSWLSELYSVGTSGGRVRQMLTTPAQRARFAPDGRTLAYHDHKGYENDWRKHHTSAVARDVWTFDLETGRHRKVTSFKGEDRNPVWAPGGADLYYLSERSGSFNVWKTPATNDSEAEQVTSHGPHPVRFLSAATDGTLCYGLNGELWLWTASGGSARVDVQVTADDRHNAVRVVTLRDGATEMAVSPEEDEVAFVIRGEIFVASVEHGTTKRVTDTPEQERSLAWSPDGRSIYFAGERDSSWNLYKVSLARADEERFFHSTVLKEDVVLVGPEETFQPVLSPDGKQLAYLHERDEIRVLDLATKRSRTLVPADKNYSYADGDVRYRWSPDGKWLAFTFLGSARWVDNVGVVAVSGGQIVNVTQSGYWEGDPRWSRDGRSLLFGSQRQGRRNHGGWGSDGDVFALSLTRAAHDRTRLTREEFDRLTKKEEKEKRKRRKAEGKNDDADDDDDDRDEPPPVVEIEFEGREHRLRRLTRHSAPIQDYALSPDGEALVYFAREEQNWDLWLSRMRDAETRKLVELGDSKTGQVFFTKNGESLLLRRGNGKLARVKLNGALGKDGGRPKMKPIPFAAEMTVHTDKERAYLFEHAWRQAAKKFYDPKMHGVDWPGLKAHYARYLPDVATRHDFAELLSEMLGELNASHTGAGYRMRDPEADRTASLGLVYDVTHRGDGLRVAEVIARGPCDKASSRIVPGVTVTHIGAVAITADTNPWPLLNRKVGKPLRLGLVDAAGKTWEEVVKPIGLGAESNLLYERWVLSRRALTEKLSGGRVGYVHVRGMNDASYRRVYRETLGLSSDKEALVVDTRFNGGGWLHDDLIQFLHGDDYFWFQPRGKQVGQLGAEPFARWTRPVAVVQSESNYSDAHMFPFAFKELGLGKLVGTPVAGTGTAVWWETLIDPTLYFGIPQVGMKTADGKYLENLELQPDVLVPFGPEEMARGQDPQLAAAVRVLLEEVDGK